MSQVNPSRSNSTFTPDPDHPHPQQYQHQLQQPHSQVVQRASNSISNTITNGSSNRNSNGNTNNSNSTTNLSCSTSASSIRSYTESPPHTQIHHPHQNSDLNNPIDNQSNQNNRIALASPASSLRSRTFDLREFTDDTNYLHPVDLNSSSPSVEDTIIARGITYTDNGIPRQPHVILSPRYQNQIQHNHHQHQQHYNLTSKDITGPGLHPEELLTVETRQLQNQNYHRAQLVHQPNQQINTDDDDSLSIVNNYRPHQRHHPNHTHHHSSDNATYTVRSDPNYYPPGAEARINGSGANANSLKMMRQTATERETTPPSLKSTIIDLDDETFQGLKARIDSPPIPHVNGFGKSFRQRHPAHMPASELHHHAVQDGTKIYQNTNNHKHVQFSTKNRYCKPKTYLAPGLTPMDALVQTFLGSSPLVKEVLQKKQDKILWSPLIFLECFLRSVSAVSLAPNPISGALIFIAMLIVTPLAAMLGSLALISGIVTAIFIVQMPVELVRGGGVTFNCYLLGTAIGELSSEEIWKDRVDIFILSTALGSIIVFVCCGLDGMVSRHGLVRVPLLNAPFNLTALLYVTSGLAALYKAGTVTNFSPPFQGIDVRLAIDNNNFSVSDISPGPGSAHPGPGQQGSAGNAGDFRSVSTLNIAKMGGPSGLLGYGIETGMSSVGTGSNVTSSKNSSNVNLTLWDMSDSLGFEPIPLENITLEWVLVLQGVLLAPSQFYGTKTMRSSAIVYAAWLLFSPILFCQTVVGAFIGNLIGVALDDPPYTALYSGGWAYNSLLTSSAIGGLYFIFNLKSWLMSVVGSVLSALVFAGMLKAKLPTLGIPFMLITWVLLPATFNYQETEEIDGQSKNEPAVNGAWSIKKSEPQFKKWMTLMRVPLAEVQTPEAHLMEHWKSNRKSIARIIPALSRVSAAATELHI